MHHKQKFSTGFTLIEILITVTIMVILAVIAVPAYTQSQRRNNVRNTLGEIESLVKHARTFAITGQSADGTALPIGGFGVFVSTELPATDPIYNNIRAIQFIDDAGAVPDFVDDGEFTEANDVLSYHTNVYASALYDQDCTALFEAALIYQPPRGDMVMKSRAVDGTLGDITRLQIVIASTDTTVPSHMLDIVKTTGTVQRDPETDACP